MSVPAETVKSHLDALAVDLGLSDAKAAEVWAEIEHAYAEGHRHYHTLAHIAAMLSGFEAHRIAFEDPNGAELAILYHDLVYDPCRADNEHLSSLRLSERLSGDFENARLARACRHIGATCHHALTGDLDTNLILDLDMAILGAPWPEYLAYAKGVFAEYVPVFGAAAYRKGRVERFLTPTLAKPAIFLTKAFADLEAAARQNLVQERALWVDGDLDNQSTSIAPS